MKQALRNALVIGGGFSGMSAAIALSQRGVQVDLIEVDPGWRSYGAGISLGGATLRAFEMLGILPQFLQNGFASDGMDLFTPNGHLITQLPTPRAVGAGPQVPGGGAIMRPVLARVMAEATRAAGVRVRLGCQHVALQQDAEGVEVTFSDDTSGERSGDKTGRYDLVVGADGLQSRLRSELFPEAPKPAYSGQGVWRAVLPRPAAVQRVAMWMGGPVKPGVNPVSDEQMYLFLTETRPVNDHVEPAQQPALLRALLEPFTDPLLQTVRAQIDVHPQNHAQVIYRPLSSLLLPRPWFRGRVVLIGDAVHATTPHLASGACIGIEDGLVLADEMSGASSVDEGLQRFQARRWERCRMVVESSNKLGEIEITGGSKEEHGQLMRTAQQTLAQPI